MNTSSHLQQQGSPILLLADLLRRHPQLPAVSYHVDDIYPDQLEVSIHRSVRRDFETWRQVLGLPTPSVKSYGPNVWLTTVGVVDDVRVELRGYGTPDEVAAVVELADAVALLGALPMPTGAPLPGELAEQRHLIDPLDHVLEHLADERPAVQA